MPDGEQCERFGLSDALVQLPRASWTLGLGGLNVVLLILGLALGPALFVAWGIVALLSALYFSVLGAPWLPGQPRRRRPPM